jgi:catechol 1,2-dioxygenase
MKKTALLAPIIAILALSGCQNSESPFLNQITDQSVIAQGTEKKQDKSAYQDYIGQKVSTNSLTGCRTTPDILGPFYRANAPFRNNLRIENSPGTPLIVRGTVFGKNCNAPLAGALIEVWHADNDGNYDNDSDKFLYRASLKTDASGRYEIKTIIPQAYDIGNNQFRPEHIHFKVTSPGYNDLVTQTYFKNDQFIPTDPWASKPEAKLRILELKKTDTGESLVQFDIHL